MMICWLWIEPIVRARPKPGSEPGVILSLGSYLQGPEDEAEEKDGCGDQFH